MLLPLASAESCIAYACADSSNAKWSPGVCGQQDPSNSTQYLLNPSACTIPEQCDYSQNHCDYPQNSCVQLICTNTNPVQPALAFPGEPCDFQHICLNGVSCMNGLCATNTFNCAHIQDCGPGKYCNDTRCWTQVPAGGMCFQDTDCVNSALCDRGKGADPGICVTYASVPAGQPVLGCPATNNTLTSYNLCQSGFCFANATDSFLCTYTLKTSQSLPWMCSGGDEECVSTLDPISQNTYHESCSCGYDGFSYCSQFPGDPDMSLYLADVFNFLTNSTLERCNTARHSSSFPYPLDPRWSWCSSVNLTDAQLYRALRANLYPQIVQASPCVLKALQPQYYSLSETAKALWGMPMLAAVVLG